MHNERHLPILQRLRAFQTIGLDLQTQLCDIATEVRLAAKETLFKTGDPSDALYALVRGRVSVVIGATKSATVHSVKPLSHVVLVPAPCLFGEMGYIQRLPRMHCVEAAEDSMLLRFADPHLSQLLASQPELWRMVAYISNEKVRNLFERNLLLAQSRPLKRLAFEIIKIASMRDTLVDMSLQRKSISITHSQLADVTGLTRQSATKTLKELEHLGLIACGYGRIDILNWAQLEDLALSQ